VERQTYAWHWYAKPSHRSIRRSSLSIATIERRVSMRNQVIGPGEVKNTLQI
jgi:hypothetical protein